MHNHQHTQDQDSAVTVFPSSVCVCVQDANIFSGKEKQKLVQAMYSALHCSSPGKSWLLSKHLLHSDTMMALAYTWLFLLNFFQKILQYFPLRDKQAFLYGSCSAVRRSKLVDGMCSMLPYDTGICCYAFIWYFNFFFYCFCPFLFYTFLKSGIDKLTEWSMIPVCPSLMCFF